MSVAQPQKIYLISCVKSKKSVASRASEMYVSTLFKKMMAYAIKQEPDAIFILSAKYGLLEPYNVIDPYEMTLNKMKKSERIAWSNNVIEKLAQKTCFDCDQYFFLAGIKYRENLIGHLKNFHVPMENMTFGRQLRWLEQNS